MLGIPILQKSGLTTTCDQCGATYGALEGGACPECRRVLCPAHLYGSWLQRLRAEIGGRVRCVSCRAGRPAPREGR